ncbi:MULTISPECIES: hypothetical protein [unclassified Janthinobacterium]|uniref:hypothetical protein n=1 Tax=unclassified Janthinobacterium TaxID=2610881 RepID=UPI001113CA2F|nr:MULTISPECIES: hypothetical protein [unclassified Janthinobacterium]
MARIPAAGFGNGLFQQTVRVSALQAGRITTAQCIADTPGGSAIAGASVVAGAGAGSCTGSGTGSGLRAAIAALCCFSASARASNVAGVSGDNITGAASGKIGRITVAHAAAAARGKGGNHGQRHGDFTRLFHLLSLSCYANRYGQADDRSASFSKH